MSEPHISDNFRKEQIEKFKELNLNINDRGQDGHTVLHNVINTYLKSYLDKYTLINNNPSDKKIDLLQNQIGKYYKIVENLIISGANPSVEADNILNLLAVGSLQIQNLISKISDSGHKYLAHTGFKTLITNVKELVEKTVKGFDLKDSSGGNNIIAMFGNIIWSIKQNISKTTDQEKNYYLIILKI